MNSPRIQQAGARLNEFVKKPRVRKIALWSVGGVALFTVIGFLVAPYVVKAVLEKQLSAKLHRPTTVQEVAINPYALSATVRGFAVKEREGDDIFVAFDELYVNLQAESLFRLAPVLSEIKLTRPQVKLVRNADRNYNFSDLAEEFLNKPATGGPPPQFALHNIQLIDGRVDFDDKPMDKKHAVTEINFGVPFVSNLPSQVDIFVEPSFSAKVNDAPLVLTGKGKPFSATRDTSIDVNFSNVDLTAYDEYSPLPLNFKLPSGKLDAKLDMVFSQPAGQPPALSLAGDVGVRELELTEKGGQPLAKLKSLAIAIGALDVFGNKLKVDRVTVEAPVFNIRRDKGGTLNVVAALPGPGEKSEKRPEPPVDSGQAKAAAFVYSVGEIKLSDGKLQFADAMAAQPFSAAVEGIAVTVKGLSNAEKGPTAVALELNGAGDAHAVRVQEEGAQEPLFTLASLALNDAELDLGKRTFTVGELTTRAGKLQARRDKDGSFNLERLAPPPHQAETPSAAQTAAQPAQPAWTVLVRKLNLEGYALRLDDKMVANSLPFVIDPLNLKVEDLSTAPGSTAKLDLDAKSGKKGTFNVSGSVATAPLKADLKLDVKDVDLVPLQAYFTEKVNVTVTRGAASTRGAVTAEQPEAGNLKATFRGDANLTNFLVIDKPNSADLLKWKSLFFSRIDFNLAPLTVNVDQIALADFYARVILSPEGKLNLQQLMRAPGEAAPVDKPAEKAKEQTAAKDGDKTPGGQAETTLPTAEPASGAAGSDKGVVQKGVVQKKGKSVAELKPADTSPLPYKARIRKVVLQGGNVNFTDLFIKPNYNANMVGIGGSVSGLSSEAGTTADVDLRGELNNAPLEIVGKVNPLARDVFLDLKASVKGMELAPLSPYSGKYAGYGIEKGKLSVNVHYSLENRKLQAENNIFLDQLTFGERVESPVATKLPVLLAVSLLKNRRGEIDVHLPVSGSLDDPQFSIGGLIVQVIVNLLVKAVTSPFALLGSMFGGGEELGYAEFDYGRYAISQTAEGKLEKLAKALNDRPALKLEIAGHVDPENDKEGAKRAQMERKVKAQKLKETVKGGGDAGSLDDVQVSPEEYAKYLKAAYKEEKFSKPRNLVGLAKDLPPEEMEKLMIANAQVSEDDLRNLANQRAQAVKEWLLKKGQVPADRIFIVAPKLNAEEPKDKGGENPKEGAKEKPKASRADFSLK